MAEQFLESLTVIRALPAPSWGVGRKAALAAVAGGSGGHPQLPTGPGLNAAFQAVGDEACAIAVARPLWPGWPATGPPSHVKLSLGSAGGSNADAGPALAARAIAVAVSVTTKRCLAVWVMSLVLLSGPPVVPVAAVFVGVFAYGGSEAAENR